MSTSSNTAWAKPGSGGSGASALIGEEGGASGSSGELASCS